MHTLGNNCSIHNIAQDTHTPFFKRTVCVTVFPNSETLLKKSADATADD